MLDSEATHVLRQYAGCTDSEIDLAEAALVLASRARPGVSLNRYRNHLAELVQSVGSAFESLPEGPSRHQDALASVIHDNVGYEGDRQTYDDLQNANLMRVIDRRKGLPIALGILYLHCGRALGWDICGLNFPGHFLIRLDTRFGEDARRTLIDPFNGGGEVTVAELRDLLKATHGEEAELSPGHYAEAGNRDILIRLQNNRKIRLLKADKIAEGLAAVEDMLLFAPGEAGLWHEAGLLNAHQGNLRAALIAFDHCYDLTTNPAERAQIADLISEIRGRLN